MSSKAIKTFNADVSNLHKAQNAETKAKSAETKADGVEKTDTSKEKTALANIASEVQSITDQFEPGAPALTSTQQQKLLGQMYTLGQEQVKTTDSYTTKLAADKKTIASDAKKVKVEKKDVNKAYAKAKGALKPAEYVSSLKQTNKERKEVGLKAVSKVIRPPEASGLAKAVQIAKQAVSLEAKEGCYDYTESYGARTNYGGSPTTKQRDGRITFDCSGFVGAVYKAAGLPSPYTVGYTGTSYDVAVCKNMKQVSASQAKPGDVVVFPDHIALCIGNGQCISMGEEGDPRIVSIAAEAAYENRGIQGFYAPKSA